MTRENYQKIFIKIYIICQSLGVLACVGLEWLLYWNTSEIKCSMWEWFWTRESSIHNHTVMVLAMLVALPPIATWIVAAIVRLTSRLQSTEESSSKNSFVEQKSKMELFVMLYFVLILPYILIIISWGIISLDIPMWLNYAMAIGMAGMSYLLLRFLSSLTRIKNSAWKITATILFAFGIVCSQISVAVVYALASIENRDEWVYENDNTDDPYECFENMEVDELCRDMAVNLWELYSNNAHVIHTSSNIMHYNPDVISTSSFAYSYPEDATPQEREKYKAEQLHKDSITLRVKKLYHWITKGNGDYFQIIEGLAKEMTPNRDKIDDSDFAQKINMLNAAYNDLVHNSDEGQVYYMYKFASDNPLKWSLYCDNVILDPYIHYTARNDGQMQDQLMWAYSFWGRRHNDGTMHLWRFALDRLLDLYPNKLYSGSELEKQRDHRDKAEKRVGNFLSWYKNNHWAFKELKTAVYDKQGTLQGVRMAEVEKYIHALEKGGYMAPQFIRDFYEWMTDDNVEAQSTESGEWWREDPVVKGYDLVAANIENIHCTTSLVVEPDREMEIEVFLSHDSQAHLIVGVLYSEGVWSISSIRIAQI